MKRKAIIPLITFIVILAIVGYGKLIIEPRYYADLLRRKEDLATCIGFLGTRMKLGFNS